MAGWYLAGVAEHILGWENLTLVKLSPYEVAFKTAHGYYVSAGNESDSYLLRGRSDRILGWEVFKIHYPGQSTRAAERLHLQLFGEKPWEKEGPQDLEVAFTTHTGAWVRCGDVRDAFRLVGDGPQMQSECRFKLRVLTRA